MAYSRLYAIQARPADAEFHSDGRKQGLGMIGRANENQVYLCIRQATGSCQIDFGVESRQRQGPGVGPDSC